MSASNASNAATSSGAITFLKSSVANFIRRSLYHSGLVWMTACIEPLHPQHGATCSQCLNDQRGSSCSRCKDTGFDCTCACPDKGGNPILPTFANATYAFIISGDRRNPSKPNPSRAWSAYALCKQLHLHCKWSPAVYLTTNGAGRCHGGHRLSGEARGIVGLHLGHLDVWHRIVRSNLSVALVLEDDAVLPTDLSPLTARRLVQALLRGSAPATERGPSERAPGMRSSQFRELLFLGYWEHTCTHAYAVTRAGALKLLQLDSLVCNPKWPVDAAMHQYACSRGLHCAYALPDLPNRAGLTKYSGILKQRSALFDRQNWGFRRALRM
jgi:hypothetical protein